MSLPRVESFELQDMKSFITASEQDGDDGEAWHDACSAATSTSFASARGWVSCSEASFRSIRGSACSAAQGAVTVQDAAAAKVSQPDAPSPKAAAPMREPPIVDAEELPTCKRARSREDILQVEVPMLVLGLNSPAVAGFAASAPLSSGAQASDAATNFPSTFSTTDTVSLLITPAADGSSSVQVQLNVVPAVFLFGSRHATAASDAAANGSPVTFKQPRITDDTVGDVAPKSTGAVASQAGASTSSSADFGLASKDQTNSKKNAADAIKGLLSKLSLTKTKPLSKTAFSPDMPSAALVAASSWCLNMVPVNVVLAAHSYVGAPSAPTSEPDVAASEINLEAALHMQVAAFKAEQDASAAPKLSARVTQEESIDWLLGAAVRRCTEGSEGGSVQEHAPVPPLALEKSSMPALQISDSPVLSARGEDSGPEEQGAAAGDADEEDAQHDQATAAKNAYKGLAKVVTRMMPGYVPPYVTASMNLELPQGTASIPAEVPAVTVPAAAAAPKEMSIEELDALIGDEMLQDGVESVAAESEHQTCRTSTASTADERMTIVTPPPEILAANAAAAAIAATGSEAATPAAAAAAPAVPVIPAVYPVISVDGVPVDGASVCEEKEERAAVMMTEAELMAQLAPGETLVFVTADMLAALGTGQKKRKAEVEVFPEDEGRWAPDAPAIKLSLGGSEASINNAGGSTSTSTGGASTAAASVVTGASSSAGVAPLSSATTGTSAPSTSGGGASAASTSVGGASMSTMTTMTGASTSAGGASSSATTSSGGAAAVDALPIAVKGGAAAAGLKLATAPAKEAAPKVEASSGSILVEQQLEAKLAEVLAVSDAPAAGAQEHAAAPAAAGGKQQTAKRAGLFDGLCACFAPRVQM